MHFVNTLQRSAGSMVAAVRLFLSAPRPVLLPAVRLPARQGLLLLTTLLLSLLGWLLTIPDQPLVPPNDEFVLRSDLSSSNLNNTSAEAPGRPPAPQVVLEQASPDLSELRPPSGELPPAPAQVREGTSSDTVTPAVPAPAVSVWLVPERLDMPAPEPVSFPPMDLPRGLTVERSLPILPATVLEPAREDCYSSRDPHQGDTPMMRTWKMLGLNAMLAGLFAATPALASNASGSASDAEKFEQIQKQLQELKSALADVKKAVDGLNAESNLGAQNVQRQIKDLNELLSLLRADLQTLRTRLPDSSRVAGFPPSSDTGPSPATARVEMLNTYAQPVSIVINNRRSYPLAPGERRLSDPIPAGSFTYEVLGITPPVTRTVGADKTFTVWVHPQP
jgi:hypothetical protein